MDTCPNGRPVPLGTAFCGQCGVPLQPSQAPPGLPVPTYGPQIAHYGPAVAPKSPGLSSLAGFFIPGLGSIISGKTGKGLLIMFLTFLAWVSIIFVIGFVLVPVMHIVGAVTGYNDATSWNRARGIES